jgi:hypothetical protein
MSKGSFRTYEDMQRMPEGSRDKNTPETKAETDKHAMQNV